MKETDDSMPFGRGNYLRLLLSIGLVALGFFIMSLETADYGQGFLGMTLAPCIILVGFVLGFLAIFYRDRPSSDKN